MGTLYTRTVDGSAPFLVAEAKVFLKIPAAVTSDDALITALINVVLEWGEAHTARDFRANTWEKLQTGFDDPLELRKSSIDAITSVEHLVDGSDVEVSSDDYYLVEGRWWSEVYTAVDASWPTNTDTIEQNVKVTFTTEAWPGADEVKTAMKMHLGYLYENRGDNDEIGNTQLAHAALKSGALYVYDSFAIPRGVG